jgi:hypothetical protein
MRKTINEGRDPARDGPPRRLKDQRDGKRPERGDRQEGEPDEEPPPLT